MWRQTLESWTHEHNSFVTLTYDRANIPGNWSLEPRTLQLFIKSLREAVRPNRIRYYAVGEYGEKNNRPHYHISLFGLSGNNSVHGEPVAKYEYSSRTGRLETVGGIIHDVWGRGRVDVAEFTHLTAQYCAGYVVKKLKDRKNGNEWNVPEFARMSTRPGLGREATKVLAKQLVGNNEALRDRDVPAQLRIGARKIPLGRFLLRYLREDVGFSDDYAKRFKDKVSWDKSIEMQAMFDNASDVGSFKKAYLQDIEGRLASVEARHTIWSKKGSL